MFEIEDIAQFADEDPDRSRLVVQKMGRKIRHGEGAWQQELDPGKHIRIEFVDSPVA